MSAELANVNPKPTDAELARAHAAKLMPMLEQACLVMDAIRRDGMEPQFSLSFDGNRTRVVNFDIKKSMV